MFGWVAAVGLGAIVIMESERRALARTNYRSTPGRAAGESPAA